MDKNVQKPLMLPVGLNWRSEEAGQQKCSIDYHLTGNIVEPDSENIVKGLKHADSVASTDGDIDAGYYN